MYCSASISYRDTGLIGTLDGPLDICLHKCYLKNAFWVIFKAVKSYCQGAVSLRGGGNEEKYTSLFNKNLSWENRTLTFRTCDFRVEDRQRSLA